MLTVCYPTGYLLLAVLLALFFVKASTVFYVLVLSAPLTTVAVFEIGQDSIIFYQLVFVVLALKLLFSHIGNFSDERIVPSTIAPAFWAFWIICGCSIPLALLYGDVIVVNPDAAFANVKFSFQQFSQYGYLTIAFLSCYICNRMLRSGMVSSKTIFSLLTASYVLVCALALLQLVLPAELVTELYRNANHVMYAHEGARVSSTFNEPSMLSLFIAPLFCIYLYRLVTGLSFGAFFLVVLGITVIVLNNSSSFVVGVLFALLSYILLLVKFTKRETRFSHKAILGFVLAFIAVLFVVGSDEFERIFSTFIGKIGGEGVSGTDRWFSFSHHLQVFLEHPLFGVGFGTVRSADLLTTWLSEIGMVGFACYVVPLALLVSRLVARGEAPAHEIAIYVVVYVGILLVSVPEPYYVFGWIVIGLGFYVARLEESFVPRDDTSRLLSASIDRRKQ